MNAAPNIASFLPLLPEIVLGIGAMLLLMLGAYRDERVVPVIDAGAIVLLLPEGKLVSFNGSFVVDGFARFLKILALIGSAAAILLSIDYAKREKQQRFEYS